MSETPKRIKIVCSTCKGSNVQRDATAAWDEETQEWELCGVMDQGYCIDCDCETNLEEVEITSEN